MRMVAGIRQQYFVGLDLGQSQDYTAIVIVERAELAGEWSAAWWAYRRVAELRVRHAERAPLGTEYTAVAARVRELVRGRGDCTLALDGTGVGRAVVDMLRGRIGGCRMAPVTITGGSGEGYGKGYHTVPKKDLIGELTVLLEGRELRIAEKLEAGEALRGELAGMRVKAGKRGVERMEGEKDDLVMALGLACWAARKRFGDKVVGDVGWCTRGDIVERGGKMW